MIYLLYLFIRKIELPHYYASLKLPFLCVLLNNCKQNRTSLSVLVGMTVEVASVAKYSPAKPSLTTDIHVYNEYNLQKTGSRIPANNLSKIN